MYRIKELCGNLNTRKHSLVKRSMDFLLAAYFLSVKQSLTSESRGLRNFQQCLKKVDGFCPVMSSMMTITLLAPDENSVWLPFSMFSYNDDISFKRKPVYYPPQVHICLWRAKISREEHVNLSSCLMLMTHQNILCSKFHFIYSVLFWVCFFLSFPASYSWIISYSHHLLWSLDPLWSLDWILRLLTYEMSNKIPENFSFTEVIDVSSIFLKPSKYLKPSQT